MVGVCFNSPLTDQIPQELPRCHSEGALLRVEFHLVLTEELKCFFKVAEVVPLVEAFNEHVVNIHRHCLRDQRSEDEIDQPLKSCPGVLESERHHLVAVDGAISDEHCLVFIWWVHANLIVARIRIHEAQEVVACCGFHQLVDSWQRVVILRASCIEIGEINADSPFSILLLHQYWVSQPLRVVAFSN